ncbi:MAG: hypothetical protein WKF43_07385 [Acidimicrobiales bacterium]
MTVVRPLALLLFAGGLVTMSLVGCDPGPNDPLVPGTSCPMYPANSHWHADVSQLPVHARSNAFVASIGSTDRLKADFGSGMWDGGPIGIPWVVVDSTQPMVPIDFAYADESDPGPYPIPPDAPIEGGPDSDGDRHILIVAEDGCRLYEVFDARRQTDGSWEAGSGARWDLGSNALRAAGWTSADAAGLPILPGLVRWDEVETALGGGAPIRHAIRITVPTSQRTYLWPARHQAGSTTNPDVPPMGLRLRLKPTVDEPRSLRRSDRSSGRSRRTARWWPTTGLRGSSAVYPTSAGTTTSSPRCARSGARTSRPSTPPRCRWAPTQVKPDPDDRGGRSRR